MQSVKALKIGLEPQEELPIRSTYRDWFSSNATAKPLSHTGQPVPSRAHSVSHQGVMGKIMTSQYAQLTEYTAWWNQTTKGLSYAVYPIGLQNCWIVYFPFVLSKWMLVHKFGGILTNGHSCKQPYQFSLSRRIFIMLPNQFSMSVREYDYSFFWLPFGFFFISFVWVGVNVMKEKRS